MKQFPAEKILGLNQMHTNMNRIGDLDGDGTEEGAEPAGVLLREVAPPIIPTHQLLLLLKKEPAFSITYVTDLICFSCVYSFKASDNNNTSLKLKVAWLGNFWKRPNHMEISLFFHLHYSMH